MNPWASIWFHPRQTIRQIVDTNPRHLVLPLAVGIGATNLVWQSLFVASKRNLSIPLAMVVAAGFGALFGILGLYLFGWVYRWVGSWLGGQATNVQVRAAIAWPRVPLLAACAISLMVSLVSVQSGAAEPLLPFLVTLIGTWWSFVLLCHTLGEVHGFSAWKGLATQLIPAIIVIIPIFLAVSLPYFLRGH